MFKLVIQDDEGKTTVVPLIRDEITIGRKEGNTIRLTERNVSRRHARILRNDNEVQIEDLGSYNGIRVNNARIAERVSLRISDQVQIGDYKLYLKAEGTDQVDDARTMPLERIDTPMDGTATGTPTTQGPAPAPIPVIAATPNPSLSRTGPMAVADTDPAGRPVATAAQVAALTAPTGYGKFVVVSSNFPGRELDLTRPQMVIGRTDDNDIVINHRSISRNHAKITRDPETLRYTISDLQSSNGVRVNQQDYGKVELRRGDVVDLGHVRMQFIEPGQDFVFARDAVITDVPDGSGRRGVLVAVILAVVVLGAAVAYFALKSPGEPQPPNNGDNNASQNNQNGQNPANPGGPNGSNAGSNIAVAALEIDAGVAATVPVGSGDPELKRIEGDCLGAITDKNWGALETCGNQLENVQKGAGQKYRAQAKAELAASAQFDELKSDLHNKNLKDAQKLYDKISPDSVYKADSKKQIDDKKAAIVADSITHAHGLAKSHKCDELDRYVAQQGSSLGDDVGAAISAAVKCEQAVAPTVTPAADCTNALLNPGNARCKQQYCAAHDGDAQCNSAAAAVPASCDALLNSASQAEAGGDHNTSLKLFEKSYACRPDSHTLDLTFMAACNSTNVKRAQYWWKKLSSEAQTHNVIMCIRNHITREQLDGTAP